MKTRKPLSLAEVRVVGFDALVKALGLANALRYVLLTEPGHGNYAEEREALFRGYTLARIAKEAGKSRGRRRPRPSGGTAAASAL